MGAILDAVYQFFREDDWPHTQIEGKPILRTAFSGKNGNWHCFAQAREDQFRFLFYSVCPANTPEHKRMAMAEFLTRANYGLIIGNFEMDFNDGEVRFKTSIDVEGDQLTSALIKQMVYANVFTFDKYLPGIMKVMYTDVRPLDAVNEVENPPASAS
jgi:hypothetical protein